MYCNDDSSLRRSVQAKPREMGERKGGERPGHEGGERTLSERVGMHWKLMAGGLRLCLVGKKVLTISVTPIL